MVSAMIRLTLSAKRKYRGFDYAAGLDVVRTGREWRDLAATVRVKRDSDGAIAGYKGTVRQFEVYP